MKLSQLPATSSRSFKSFSKTDNLEDLYEEDSLQNVIWTERTLFKAKPKSNSKIRKMKS